MKINSKNPYVYYEFIFKTLKNCYFLNIPHSKLRLCKKLYLLKQNTPPNFYGLKNKSIFDPAKKNKKINLYYYG